MKLPILNGREILLALEKVGFTKVRQKGSHVFMKHPDGRCTVVPVHKGSDVDRSLLQKILKDAKLDKNEFLRLLK